MSKFLSSGKLRANNALQARIAQSPVMDDLREWAEQELAFNRELFEDAPASEHQRAVVLVLRDLVQFLRNEK